MILEKEPTVDNHKLNTWPKDWDLHLARAFRSYLKDNNDSLDISFETATFNVNRFVGEDYDIDKSKLTILLKLKGKRWGIFFTYDGEFILGDVNFILAIEKVERKTEDLHAYPSGKFYNFIASPITTVMKKEVLEIIKEVYSVIWEDYWKRSGEDNDGDDNDDITEPYSPNGVSQPITIQV